MHIAIRVVGLILGLALLQALIWIPIVLWLRARSKAAMQAFRDEVAARHEHLRRGPESAIYRGGSGGFSQVRGNGMLALTDQRLYFRKLTGGTVEVPVGSITGVREDKWFLGSFRGNRLNMIVQTGEGAEVGFMVQDHAGWMETVRALTSAH